MPRKTKIICTLGPATDREDILRALIQEGMDAARFNFSHGSHPVHLARLEQLRTLADALGQPVATILDTRGPEIRIRGFAHGPVTLAAGDVFTLTTQEVEGDATQVSVTYRDLHRELAPGHRLLLDDGLIALRVEDIQGPRIRCRVENGGVLSANKSLNIPGVPIRLPALTPQDEEDLRFAAQQNFDYVAASFVRRAADVEAVRQVLRRWGGEGVKVIAKIENQEGVDHMEEILDAADGLMVARGDLGVEIPAPKVPFLQKKMIRMGLRAGKSVITATQMLDSMTRNPRPTRAEVSDVANAVFDGTSCVMLSGETAGGSYPLESLSAMAAIVTEAERSIDYWRRFQKSGPIPAATLGDAITHASCLTAMELDARAILAATSSGHTARMIARFRPACPVVALTSSPQVRRQLSICWGVVPLLVGEAESTDQLFSIALQAAHKAGLLQPGDTAVISAGVPLGESGSTNLIKAQTL